MCISLCVSVCVFLSASISPELQYTSSDLRQIFAYVYFMTSYLHIMAENRQCKKAYTCTQSDSMGSSRI